MSVNIGCREIRRKGSFMPPKAKHTKDEMVSVALGIVRRKGFGALTAREMASALGTSTQPVFTCFKSMGALREAVRAEAKNLYSEYMERGLKERIPNLGVGRQAIRFAHEEPELYKLLFQTKPEKPGEGAAEMIGLSQEIVRDSIMENYGMDALAADCYFRDLMLVGLGFATLIVTEDCPYSDAEISAIFTEFSLAICKAYKDIPGLPRGDFDRDAIFSSLTGRKMRP